MSHMSKEGLILTEKYASEQKIYMLQYTGKSWEERIFEVEPRSFDSPAHSHI